MRVTLGSATRRTSHVKASPYSAAINSAVRAAPLSRDTASSASVVDHKGHVTRRAGLPRVDHPGVDRYHERRHDRPRRAGREGGLLERPRRHAHRARA